jgi:hypothetical protein
LNPNASVGSTRHHYEEAAKRLGYKCRWARHDGKSPYLAFRLVAGKPDSRQNGQVKVAALV